MPPAYKKTGNPGEIRTLEAPPKRMNTTTTQAALLTIYQRYRRSFTLSTVNAPTPLRFRAVSTRKSRQPGTRRRASMLNASKKKGDSLWSNQVMGTVLPSTSHHLLGVILVIHQTISLAKGIITRTK